MTKFKTLTAIMSLSAFICAGAASAANKRPAKNTVPAAPKLSPAEVLVNHLWLNKYVEGENLGDSCRRGSFKNLALALSMNDWISTPKGEFETSDQYKERSGKLSEVLAGDPIIICQPVNDNPDMEFAYYADEQLFRGSFRDVHNVWRDVKQLGTYRSKTGMGVPVTVRSSLETEYNVQLSRIPFAVACLTTNFGAHSYKVPSSLSAAPALKSQGQAVIVARLEPPYIRQSESSGSPTLTDPFDVNNYTLTVHAKIERLIIIDGKGNEAWSCNLGVRVNRLSPVPRTSDWINTSDYPSIALREGREGRTGYRVSVGKDGRVVDCAITKSSGHADLDEATCRLVTRRARFEPALDDEGYPIDGGWEGEANWQLPR